MVRREKHYEKKFHHKRAQAANTYSAATMPWGVPAEL